MQGITICQYNNKNSHAPNFSIATVKVKVLLLLLFPTIDYNLRKKQVLVR
jgi:hypothetical protein